MNTRKLAILLHIFSLILLCLGTSAFAEIRAFWKFEEESGDSIADDSSSYGNDGFLCDSFDLESCWVNGKRGGALAFDGDSTYVNCRKDSSLMIVDTLTIEMWVKFDAFTIQENILSNELYRIYHHGGDWAGDRIYFLYKIAENMKPGQSEWPGWAGVRTATELQQGRWYYLVATMSGDTMRIYVNGKKQGENICLSGFTKNSAQFDSLVLGRYGSHYFDGALDEVIIRDRALSDDEVLQRALCGWLSCFSIDGTNRGKFS